MVWTELSFMLIYLKAGPERNQDVLHTYYTDNISCTISHECYALLANGFVFQIRSNFFFLLRSEEATKDSLSIRIRLFDKFL